MVSLKSSLLIFMSSRVIGYFLLCLYYTTLA
nr:MAG TPA: hypothetical protein [Caudoviricetes sp.]